MSKSRFSDKIKGLKIVNYFRELSIVIIGVAVTLYAGNIITSIKEKKDLELQMNAIYDELEENLKRLDPIIEYHQSHEQLRQYLFTIIENPELYNKDSIKHYNKVLFFNVVFSYKRAAFDMFVNSGAMKLLSDRKQLLEITESYAMLEEFYESHRDHFDMKKQIYNNLYTVDTELLYEDYDIRDPQWRAQLNFHSLNSGMEESAVTLKEELEKVISKRFSSR